MAANCSYEGSLLIADPHSPFTTVTNTEYTTMIVLMVVCCAVSTVSLFVFVQNKSLYQRTKVRISGFIACNYFGIAFSYFALILPLLVGLNNTPCWFSFVLETVSCAMVIAANISKCSGFMIMTKLAVTTYDYGRIPVDEVMQEEDRRKSLGVWSKFCENIALIVHGASFYYKQGKLVGKTSIEEQVKILITWRLISSWYGSLLFVSLLMIPSVVILIICCLVVPEFYNSCTGCEPANLAVIILVIVYGGLGLLNGMLFSFRSRNLPDAWGFFVENRTSTRIMGLGFIGFIILAFVINVPYHYMITIPPCVLFTIAFTVNSSMQIFIASQTETRMHNRVKGVKSKLAGIGAKHESSTGPSSSNSVAVNSIAWDLKCPKLHEILSNPGCRKAFEYHLSTEFGGENTCFLQDTYDWILSYNDIAKTAAASRARKIIKTYISENGIFQINVSSRTAEPLMKISKDESGDSVTSTIFDEARREIAYLLEIGAVARFATAKEQYMSVLNSAVVAQSVA
jgi:hypothetical protein